MSARIGSLFSGYGGLDMGVQAVLGGEVVWHSEIDPNASKILAHHWPNVPNLGDITQISWDQVPPVDILTGGFPCQDVSTAGARAGLAGARSGLWSIMSEAIDHLKPKLVVIENVGGLLSASATSSVEPCPWCLGDGSDGPHMRALGAVLADLAGIGFDAEWGSLTASAVGAPHRRNRVFIVAYPADTDRNLFRELARGAFAEEAGPDQSDGLTDPRGGSRTLTLLPTPVADNSRGLPSPTTDYQSLPNAVVSLLPTPQSTNNENRQSEGYGPNLGAALSLLPTPRATEGTHGGPNQRGSKGDLTMSSVVHLLPTPSVADVQGGRKHRSGSRSDELLLNGLAAAEAFGEYGPAIHRWETTLGRPAPPPTEPGTAGRPRLSPAFVEWMMGLPAGHVTATGISRVAQLTALGNGVVPQQAAAAIRLLLERANQ